MTVILADPLFKLNYKPECQPHISNKFFSLRKGFLPPVHDQAFLTVKRSRRDSPLAPPLSFIGREIIRRTGWTDLFHLPILLERHIKEQ